VAPPEEEGALSRRALEVYAADQSARRELRTFR